VAVYAVDPKMTRTTLVREAPLPLRILFALFAASPEKSRDLVVRAATAPELAGQSGIYLTRKPRETFSPHSDDAGARGRLWELSAERVGIAAHPPAIAVVG
jgi:hypothetical protein